ncbi:MAG: hypothetical protein H2057_06660 [Alphaproteobacteria bacterium]|nr:hypothetical protein [Alphaproteobacteria bacterium]
MSTPSLSSKKKISAKKLPGKEEVLALLSKLTYGALDEGNYSVALKGIELLGKELGLFTGHKATSTPKTLEELSMADLEALLEITPTEHPALP